MGVALAGGGIVGVDTRYNVTPKFSLDFNVSLRPTVITVERRYIGYGDKENETQTEVG